MARAQNGDVAIEFHAWGDRDATPVVLLHGLGDDHRLWDGVRARLRGRLRVVAYDLRGHGASDAPSDAAAYTMPLFVEDLARVLDAAAIERALLVGFSLGGAIAAAFALAHPERTLGLALVNANAAARDPAEEATIVAARGSATAVLPAERERRWAERLLARLPDGARRASAIGRAASIVKRAGDLAVPVWLIASDRDPGFARRSLALLPRLRRGVRIVIPGAGHAVMIDRAEALANELSRFAATAGTERPGRSRA